MYVRKQSASKRVFYIELCFSQFRVLAVICSQTLLSWNICSLLKLVITVNCRKDARNLTLLQPFFFLSVSVVELSRLLGNLYNVHVQSDCSLDDCQGFCNSVVEMTDRDPGPWVVEMTDRDPGPWVVEMADRGPGPCLQLR